MGYLGGPLGVLWGVLGLPSGALGCTLGVPWDLLGVLRASERQNGTKLEPKWTHWSQNEAKIELKSSSIDFLWIFNGFSKGFSMDSQRIFIRFSMDFQ